MSFITIQCHYFPRRDLYPSLAKALQSVHRLLAPSDPLLPLQIQRVLALLCLLTQVTHTAGCHQELQAGMVRYRRGFGWFYKTVLLHQASHRTLKSLFISSVLREKNALLLHQCSGAMLQGCRRPYWGIWRALWRASVIQSRKRPAWLWYQLTWPT